MNPISDTGKPRLAEKARLKWDNVREKNLLLFPEGVLLLNPTAHSVLALCDGHRDINEIVKTLENQFHATGLLQDVKEILQRLADKGLVNILE